MNKMNTASTIITVGKHANRVSNGEETVGEAALGVATDTAIGAVAGYAATTALAAVGGAAILPVATPVMVVGAVVSGICSLFD